MSPPTISAKALKERCAGLVSSILNRGLASQQECDAVKPGGERNPGTTCWEWLHFYGVLSRWLEREQIAAGRSVRPDQVKTPGAPVDSDGEEALFAMLSDEPESLPLRLPLAIEGSEQRLEYLTINPKGYLALVEIGNLDRDMRWLASRLLVLDEVAEQGLATSEDLAAARATSERIAEYTARIVWSLTTPGPECPYDPIADRDPATPAHLRAIDPLDLIRVLMVHRRVNGSAMDALTPLLAGAPKGQGRASWAVFIASAARELNADPETLVKHWSLRKLVASAALAARARLDAEEAAKKERDKKKQSA